jgi:hypothetical protein
MKARALSLEQVWPPAEPVEMVVRLPEYFGLLMPF